MSKSKSESLEELTTLLAKRENQDLIAKASSEVRDLICECQSKRKIITIFGNGGSAADAQHWAGELVCTYKNRLRDPIPAISITTNASIITAWSNDFDYTDVFRRQVSAFRHQNGLSIGLSTSGKSLNVRRALTEAAQQGANTVFITGSNAPSFEGVTMHIKLPSAETPVVQTLTQVLWHRTCELLEAT